MKSIFLFILVFLTATFVYAQDVQVPHYESWVEDLTYRGHRKENLFSEMQKKIIKFDGSICSNRAHMWAYDFQRFYEVDSAKLFLFYTSKTSRAGGKDWWYHVTPIVNERGALYAMDRAFMNAPVTVDYWLKYFAGKKSTCYEIKNDDVDLIQRMFITMPFPEKTYRGEFDCYYKIVPKGIWFPMGIAMDLLQTDRSGTPIYFNRNSQIPEGEVYEACLEAAKGDGFRLFSSSAKKKCRHYLEASYPGEVKLPF